MEFQKFISLLITSVCLSSCGGNKALDIQDPVVVPPAPLTMDNFAGNIFVSTLSATPSTGPGLLSMFKPDGNLDSLIFDFYYNAQFVSGLAFFDDHTLLVAVDGIDRIDAYDILTGDMSPFIVHAGLGATPLRQIAVASDQSVYVLESNANTIEKFSSTGQRIGLPFIPTTVGGCILANPWGVTYIPSSGNIAVISNAAAGRLSIYNSTGGCVAHVTAAPLASGTPTGIAYHEDTDKLLVTFETTDAVWAFNSDGTGAVLVYQNTSYIDAPRAITVDDLGYVYVASNVTDTIEKFTFDGTTLTRALTAPLMGPSIYTQNPTAILVVPQ